MVEGYFVKDVYRVITKDALTAREDESISVVADRLLKEPLKTTVAVVDGTNKLKGIVTVKEILESIMPEQLPRKGVFTSRGGILRKAAASTVGEIAAPPLYVSPEDTLRHALKIMYSNDIRDIPVVDDTMKVIGDLSMLEIVYAWLHHRGPFPK